MASSSGNLVLSILEGGGGADKLQELNASDDWIDFSPQPPFSPSTLADYAVYAIDRNFIIVHERVGDFLHFDGAVWNRFSQASAVQILAIHIISPVLAHAVDVSGDLFQWLGTSWALLGNAGAALNGVWASSASNVYAIGGTGGQEKVMLWDGATLTNVYSSLPSGSGVPTDVWGFGPNDISVITNIANSSSRFLQGFGTSWLTKVTLGGFKIMTKIWGTAASNLWIATGIFTNPEVHFWNGSALVSQQAAVIGGSPTGLHGLSASEIYWTDQGSGAGDTWKFNGSVWTEINSLLRVDTRAVWVGPVLLVSPPPTITFVSPGDRATGVAKDKPLVVSITDANSQVVQSAIRLFVRGELVYNGTSFTAGYTGSTIVANGSNGFDISVVPDRTTFWRGTNPIELRVVAENAFASVADETFFFTPGVRGQIGAGAGGLKIYPMIIRSIRNKDERG